MFQVGLLCNTLSLARRSDWFVFKMCFESVFEYSFRALDCGLGDGGLIIDSAVGFIIMSN